MKVKVAENASYKELSLTSTQFVLSRELCARVWLVARRSISFVKDTLVILFKKCFQIEKDNLLNGSFIPKSGGEQKLASSEMVLDPIQKKTKVVWFQQPFYNNFRARETIRFLSKNENSRPTFVDTKLVFKEDDSLKEVKNRETLKNSIAKTFDKESQTIDFSNAAQVVNHYRSTIDSLLERLLTVY